MQLGASCLYWLFNIRARFSAMLKPNSGLPSQYLPVSSQIGATPLLFHHQDTAVASGSPGVSQIPESITPDTSTVKGFEAWERPRCSSWMEVFLQHPERCIPKLLAISSYLPWFKSGGMHGREGTFPPSLSPRPPLFIVFSCFLPPFIITECSGCLT